MSLFIGDTNYFLYNYNVTIRFLFIWITGITFSRKLHTHFSIDEIHSFLTSLSIQHVPSAFDKSIYKDMKIWPEIFLKKNGLVCCHVSCMSLHHNFSHDHFSEFSVENGKMSHLSLETFNFPNGQSIWSLRHRHVWTESIYIATSKFFGAHDLITQLMKQISRDVQIV